jgi:hypothetical protein
MTSQFPVQDLAQRIVGAMSAPETIARATRAMELTRSLGLYSDWDPCVEKVIDFGSLIEAAARVLPPGGSIETGVYRGGTSGPLIVCASPDTFHLSIDPFGLPSQSYSEHTGDYGAWTEVRKTLARLAELGLERSVTYCHYLMASSEFISADLLLHHQSSFRIVHLDGAHTKAAVVDELAYFRRRLPGPTLFILDDHDTNFPGVEEAVNSPAGVGLVPVVHRFYKFPGLVEACAFSAWLHGS